MDRRQFLTASGAAAASLTLAGRGRAQSSRPNLVVIMADDMGYSDIAGMGSEVRTDNLTRLAQGGLTFTNFYNAARCCPTRASILTGLYPHQAGVGHMTQDEGKPGYQGHLNHNCVTMAEALKPAGYQTYMAGKWHVGAQEGQLPVDRGFDEFFGILSGSSDYFKPGKKSKLYRNREAVEPGPGFYATDAFTDHAIDFIRQGREADPFFLYLAYNAPHWPLHAPAEDIARYEDRYLAGWDKLREERYERMVETGVIDPRWALSKRDRGTPPWSALPPWKKQTMARKMAVYAAMIDRMDQNIGRLLATLDQLGQTDNTLVLFLADNGGCHESGYGGFNWNPGYTTPWKVRGHEVGDPGSFASYGRGWANASNTPFRLHKHWTHEGGISTPLIAHWPAAIRQAGTRTKEVGHVIDVMATCLDAAGASYPATRGAEAVTPLEGQSLMPVFTGGTRPGHDVIGWEHEGNRALRHGNHKLVSDYPGSWELYDMETDRTELHDLAKKMPDQVAKLDGLYQEWAKRTLVEPWNLFNTLKF